MGERGHGTAAIEGLRPCQPRALSLFPIFLTTFFHLLFHLLSSSILSFSLSLSLVRFDDESLPPALYLFLLCSYLPFICLSLCLSTLSLPMYASLFPLLIPENINHSFSYCVALCACLCVFLCRPVMVVVVGRGWFGHGTSLVIAHFCWLARTACQEYSSDWGESCIENGHTSYRAHQDFATLHELHILHVPACLVSGGPLL